PFPTGTAVYHSLPAFPTRRSSDLIFNASPKFLLSGKPSTKMGLVSERSCLSILYFSTNGFSKSLIFCNISLYLISIILRLSHVRSEEHTSELQSRENLICRLLLEK